MVYPRMLPSAACITGVALVLAGGSAHAQNAASTSRPAPTFAAWTAFAGNQPLATRMGDTHDRDMYLVGLRARWLLNKQNGIETAYFADLLPAVVSTEMPRYNSVTSIVTHPGCWGGPCNMPIINTTLATPATAYGVGAVPLGYEVRVRAGKALAFGMRGSAGVVYFSRPIPDPDERRLNVILAVGAGTEVYFSPRFGLIAGYHLNHISNAGRGPVNPGMNSHMLELGVVFSR